MNLARRLRVLTLLCLLPALQAAGQSLTQLGLRSQAGQGRFRGLQADATGNLYTLLDAQDGVRLVKMNAAATQVLGETHLGQQGDQGLALALDADGNVYVCGTSLSTGSIGGTAGTSYPNRADTTTNSFLARFNSSLTEQWLTFLGSGRMAVTAVAATATQVVVTGGIYAKTLPVTPDGIQQQPLPNSNGNGFVQSFDPATGTLRYSTYLSGANGDTQPNGIALDGSGNAYIVGSTTATGFPTLNALVPLLQTDAANPLSGFLTRLTPSGDGFLFSSYIPGTGLDAIVVDTATGSLLASGNIALGLFPLTEVRAPIAATVSYRSALRLPLDGSAVISATLLAPGTASTVAAAPTGFVAGVASESANVTPLLPVPALEPEGSAFLLAADANGVIQRTARLGGIPVTNAGFASVPAYAGGVLAAADGSALLAGGIAPTLSSALRATQRYDVTHVAAPNTALPSTVRDALPDSTCSGSACAGGAALLARMAPSGGAVLALSLDDLPTVTVRNPGTTEATGLQVNATGYTVQGACDGTLPAGSECDVLLTGTGPGTLTVSAGNTAAAAANLPANTRSADTLSILPKQLDFGITSAATPRSRTITVVNPAAAPQTFTSKAGIANSTYTVSESASTCTPVGDGVSKTVAAGSRCTITLQLAAGSDPTNDGPARATWIVGPREVTLTGAVQASAITLSATHLGFGRQYQAGLRSPRYLYVSNGSDIAQAHTAVALSPNSPFKLTDGCPATLAPQSVCRIAVNYASSVIPSADATTLAVDGITVLIDGQTVPQPGVTGASANPNLTVTPTTVTFAQSVVATTVSSETQSVTIRNTGATEFTLALTVTGDFTGSDCPGTLAGGASCVVTLHFTPGDAGTRQGLLSVTAGNSGPLYVTLTGQGTAFLPGNGLVGFGETPLQTPVVRWFKIAQSFASLTLASSSSDFRALLLEDQGYGYGTPDRSRFQQNLTGSCLNCYLGIQFNPSQAGTDLATMAITSTSGGAAQTVALSGTGRALTGVLLSPASLDLGSVPVGSTTGSSLFTLTNATSAAITTAAPSFTGDFSLSGRTTGGTPCGSTLRPGESCTVPVQFAPASTGPRTGTLTVATSAGAATSPLSGFGDADPGIAFQPGSLFFRNVPGTDATQQTIALTNTGSLAATIGTPTSSDSHFTAVSTCSTIAPGAQCGINLTYVPTASLASGLLTVPVTTAPGGAAQTTNYTLRLSGLYTSDNAGLQIIPGEETAIPLGSLSTGTVSGPRVFRVNNLSGKALTLSLEAPRQFPITATTCAGLAAGGSCTVTMAYAPLLNADATGTLFVQGTPTDGTATQNGLAYLQGYGLGTGTVAVSGNLTPTGVLDFGQVPSGQSVSQNLAVRNLGTTGTITVRRIRADFPFAATSDCGQPLTPSASCTVTLTYAPNAQTTVGGNAGSQDNTGVLTIESDAENSPLLVDLAGRTVPTQSNAAAPAIPVAALTTSQGSLTFGTGMVGSASGTQTVNVVNTGTVALHVGGVITSPDVTATSNCGTLAVGAACQVSVSFTPQSQGTRSGSLEIQSDAANALEYVSLLGTATPASVNLSPTSLDFGRVLVGSGSAAQAVTLTNTGSSAATVGTLSISGDFSINPTSAAGTPCTTGAALAPGASCAISLVFTPAQTGTRVGTLSVATSATQLPLTVTLGGVGVQPQLSVTPTSLNFGDVFIGKSQTLALTLSNVSAAAVNALRIGVSAGDFTVAATCGPVTLAAGSSCSLNVTFTPTQTGTRTATLTIGSTDPASPLTVPLTGNALQAGSFTLTVNGAANGTATVAYGIQATYALAVTPLNGFAGAVALTCAPKTAAQYINCSIDPATVTLSSGTVNATATITTVTAVPTAQLSPAQRWSGAVLCALPVLLLTGLRRRTPAILASVLLTAALLLAGGCGGGVGDKRIRYAAPGTYQFTLTATSTTGVTAQQSANLTLTITDAR